MSKEPRAGEHSLRKKGTAGGLKSVAAAVLGVTGEATSWRAGLEEVDFQKPACKLVECSGDSFVHT